MEIKRKYSIIYPDFEGVTYKTLSETAFHDLALDVLCNNLSKNIKEAQMIRNIISKMTADSRVSEYRRKVFCDILKLTLASIWY